MANPERKRMAAPQSQPRHLTEKPKRMAAPQTDTKYPARFGEHPTRADVKRMAAPQSTPKR